MPAHTGFHRVASVESPSGPANENGQLPPRGSIRFLARRIGSWRLIIERDPLPAETLQRRYAALASGYTRMLRRFGFTRAYAGLAQQFVAKSPGIFGPAARVLDCGSGSGALSLALADATRFGLQHHLLDVSLAMLEVAAHSLASRGLKTRAAWADARSIPYGEGYFDAVVAAHVIEHLVDPVEVLREMHRVTRPGGRSLIIVTRLGLLGTAVHLRWRVHCASTHRLQGWLELSGWKDVRFLELEGPWWCKRMSIACMASKLPRSRDGLAPWQQTGALPATDQGGNWPP